MLLLLLTTAIFSSVNIDGISYDLADGKAKVIGCEDNMTVLAIPPTVEYQGASYTVNEVVKAFTSDPTRIVEVTVPDTVISIGEEAFSGTSIQTFVWPPAATTIPKNCFTKCQSLKSVSGIENVKLIEKSGFANSGITSLQWPSGVTMIPSHCFEACVHLNTVSNTQHVTSIEDFAFYKSGITSFVWPHDAPIISKYCFCECQNLLCVNGTANVTSIEDFAFYKSGITSFHWPPEATTIPYRCFYYCKELKTITGLEKVISIQDAAFFFCGLTHYVCSPNISFIGPNSFGFCLNLEEFRLDSNFYLTDQTVFRYANTLLKIVVPSNYPHDTFCGITVIREDDNPPNHSNKKAMWIAIGAGIFVAICASCFIGYWFVVRKQRTLAAKETYDTINDSKQEETNYTLF